MAISIQNELAVLKANRLMETNEQTRKFISAMENIFSLKNPEVIEYLCEGFDDDTEENEVMFDLVHTIEAYDKIVSPEIATGYFIKGINLMHPHAKGWIEIMLIRILNEDNSRIVFSNLIKHADAKTKKNVRSIIEGLVNEDPEEFSDKGTMVMSYL
jgi:hypothetical protein